MANFPNEIQINPQALNKMIIGGIVLVLILLGIFTSFFKVDPREHAIVLRLGQFTGATVTDQGLHFKLPFGIDKVYHVEVTTVRKLEFGFATLSTQPQRSTRYSSRNEVDASLIVTGDLNVADVEWSTQYLISDAYKFLFKVRDPIRTFRAMNEAVMREVVGDRTIDEVLTSGREEVEQQVEEKLRALVDQYQLGIKLDKVILQNVNPPKEVNESWEDVNQAQQERAQKINTAQAAFNKVIPKSRGDALRIIEEANGYAVERVNKAEGDADLFKKVFTAYQKAPEVTRKRIYLETMSKILATGPKKIVMDDEAKGLLPLLNLNPESK
jgi:membrane protease subunit HflK